MLDASKIQLELDRAVRDYPRLQSSIHNASRKLDELSRKKRDIEDQIRKDEERLDKNTKELKTLIEDIAQTKKSLEKDTESETLYKRKVDDLQRQLETIKRSLNRK